METTVSIWPAIIWIAIMVFLSACKLFKMGVKRDAETYFEGCVFFLLYVPLHVLLMWSGNFFAPLGWGV